MKHVKTFERFRIKKNREDIIRESVLQVNDIYKVKSTIEIPQSLLNSYIKKVKDTTGKNLRTYFGDVDLAEEIVKWITTNSLDVDKIPGNALMGGQVQGQAQAQGQAQVEPQAQPEPIQNQAQNDQGVKVQVEGEAQPQAQPSDDEFEAPQAQPQAQPQVQGQVQPQGEEEEEEETELPI